MTEEEIVSAAISRLGGWIAHDGGMRPTGLSKKRVVALLRNDRVMTISEYWASAWVWRYDEDPGLNVMAYRIVDDE